MSSPVSPTKLQPVTNFHGIPAEELQAACFNLGLTMKVTFAFMTSVLNVKPGEPPQPVTDDVLKTFITTHPAVTLRPITSMPKEQFEDLLNKQPLWNTLIDAIARHPTYLSTVLKDTARNDAGFTGKLVAMYEELYGVAAAGCEPKRPTHQMQPAMLGIFRNDYMEQDTHASRQATNDAEGPSLQEGCYESSNWKQVEINTVSVSFAGLSPLVADFHKLIARNALHDASAKNTTKDTNSSGLLSEDVIYRSESLQTVSASLAAAARYYTQHEMTADSSMVPVVCFVLQENERNTADQFAIAFEVESRYGVRCVRRTLLEIKDSLVLQEHDSNKGSTDTKTNELPKAPRAILDGRFEVALFYFRSCYAPSDFVLEGQWESRALIEKSNALKCPSLPHYLCTFKKVQQMLTGFLHIKTHAVPEEPEESQEGEEDNSHINQQELATQPEEDAVLRFLPQQQQNGEISVPCRASGERLRGLSTSASQSLTPFEVPVASLLDQSQSSQPLSLAYYGSKETPTQSESWLSEWIRSNMVPIYSLNPAENSRTEAIIHDAIRHPRRYVMKPQLEGGGNLIAGDEMVSLLKVQKPSEEDPDLDQLATYNRVRLEYILMSRIAIKRHACTAVAPSLLRDSTDTTDRIKSNESFTKRAGSNSFAVGSDEDSSPLFRFGSIISRSQMRNAHIVHNHYPNDDLCSELGIYGVVLTTADTAVATTQQQQQQQQLELAVRVLFNQAAGYVVRSKLASSDDGGVMAGAAFLDSLALV